MPMTKRFTNIRVGANVGAALAGPQTFPANTAWISVPVPCRGARMVVFTLKATDANGLQATNAQLTNDADGNLSLTASGTNYTVRGGGANRMNGGGGLVMAVVPSDARACFYHGFCQLSVTSNAGSAHSNFQVDAEVFYDTDADDMRGSAGQLSTQPI
jgi:hypothetical protein